MAHPVFISYARGASQSHAEALWRALGGKDGPAFLDTSDIQTGEPFPREIVDALFGSRVVVVFASQDYFQRWYCLWELEMGLLPFLALGPGATPKAREGALRSIVVVRPESGAPAPDLNAVPPMVRAGNWLRADETGGVAALVRERLSQVETTLEHRLEAAGALGAAARTALLEENGLPSAVNLAGQRVFPRALPESLGRLFVGRADDLWRIHHALSVPRDSRGEGAAGAALTGALQGVGGFGKTRMALEYFHRFGPRYYPGGLFWVNADVGPERLEEQFYGILGTLRDVPALEQFREQKRDAAREMTAALEEVATQKRILFIVDNVPEPGPGERPLLLRTWCPAIGKVSLLATSRAMLDLGTENIHALHVAPLSPEAATVLLTEGNSGAGALPTEAWQRITGWVGCMPLALELLNRTLKAGLTPAELLSIAEGQSPVRALDEQMALLEPHVPAGSLRGVTEALSLSYRRLSPEEQHAARLIAQLAPEPIPVKVLDALGEEVMTASARRTLHARHFVTRVAVVGDVGLFGAMHRVLADFLRGQAREDGEELIQVCHALAVLMTPEACSHPRDWPLMSAVSPHAEDVFDRGELLLRRFDFTTEGALALLSLGTRLGVFLSARGFARRSVGIDERVFAQSLRILGEEHPGTLLAMNNLAETLGAQNELAGARALQEQVLEARRRVLGEEHPDTLLSRSNLAGTLMRQGDLKGARTQQEQVLEARRRVLGEEHPATLTARNNLAATLMMQGDPDGARTQLERVLETRRRMLGEEHPATLTARNNLAATLGAQGDLEGARTQQEQVLEAMRRMLGDEHPATLTARNNLAATLGAQGDLESARAHLEQVLEAMRRMLGDEHPNTLTTMMNLLRINHQAKRRSLWRQGFALCSAIVFVLLWNTVIFQLISSPEDHLGVSVLWALPLALLLILLRGLWRDFLPRRAGAALMLLGLLSGGVSYCSAGSTS